MEDICNADVGLQLAEGGAAGSERPRDTPWRSEDGQYQNSARPRLESLRSYCYFPHAGPKIQPPATAKVNLSNDSIN